MIASTITEKVRTDVIVYTGTDLLKFYNTVDDLVSICITTDVKSIFSRLGIYLSLLVVISDFHNLCNYKRFTIVIITIIITVTRIPALKGSTLSTSMLGRLAILAVSVVESSKG